VVVKRTIVRFSRNAVKSTSRLLSRGETVTDLALERYSVSAPAVVVPSVTLTGEL
jgi:hypothetical protein